MFKINSNLVQSTCPKKGQNIEDLYLLLFWFLHKCPKFSKFCILKHVWLCILYVRAYMTLIQPFSSMFHPFWRHSRSYMGNIGLFISYSNYLKNIHAWLHTHNVCSCKFRIFFFNFKMCIMHDHVILRNLVWNTQMHDHTY